MICLNKSSVKPSIQCLGIPPSVVEAESQDICLCLQRAPYFRLSIRTFAIGLEVQRLCIT